MDLLVPEVIPLIPKWGAMMVLIKAGFMSLCHSLEEKNGTLTARQQSYNAVHGWYRAHIEQLFACLWHWALVRNIWRGGPSGVSCTSQSVFCCILRNFAFAGRCATPVMDHGSMSRLMFGLTKATRPPRKMRQRMREKCACCVVRSVPPSQFVVSVKSTIVLNVSTPTLVGPMLFVKYK